MLKFRGAGQGLKALIADLIGGEIARALRLKVPEMVFANLDSGFGRTEPDEEIQDLLKASVGLNLGVHYLSGAITFDPAVTRIESMLASQIVWLDCLLTNVDRTARNTNMLMWHKELWLIDHGASLYFHHSWQNWEEQAVRPFVQVKDHVLLKWADELDTVDEAYKAILTPERISSIVNIVPEDWLTANAHEGTAEERRKVYTDFLNLRIASSQAFINEAKKMQGADMFEYAVIRVVPRVEREEFINVGVVLYCKDQKFLQTRFVVDGQKLLAFSPELDIEEIRQYLDAFERISRGDHESSPIAQLDIASRFRWLTAMRSTVVQTSRVHPGFCENASQTIEKLYAQLVL